MSTQQLPLSADMGIKLLSFQERQVKTGKTGKTGKSFKPRQAASFSTSSVAWRALVHHHRRPENEYADSSSA